MSAGGIRAIIFDWAGTTVDHGSRAPVEAVIAAFRRAGIELTDAEARGPMGRAKRDHVAAILGLPRVAEAWTRRHGRPPGEADIDAVYSAMLEQQPDALRRHGEVIRGVPKVVAECRRRGLKIGCTTGYTRGLMDIALPLARDGGFDPEVVVCADDVPRGRPAPWMIFRAAERLDVYPVTSVVVVDDTAVGIEAGLNACAWTVAVTRTGNSLGLSEAEVARLDAASLQGRLRDAAGAFRRLGAHFVVEGAADLLPVIDELALRVRA